MTARATAGADAILALDTATTACSAAIYADGGLVAHRYAEMTRGQSEQLNPMIGEVMADAGLAFRALDLIAVTTGPGAFTGLRIGIACARALALASGAAMAGVTTFDTLSHAVPDDEREADRRLAICVNGKRRDVFVQHYVGGQPDGAPYALLPAEAAAAFAAGRWLIAGDGAPPVAEALAADPATAAAAGATSGARLRLSAAIRPPDAAHVAALAAARRAAGTLAMGAPRPFYIRPPDVRLPGGVAPPPHRAGAGAGA